VCVHRFHWPDREFQHRHTVHSTNKAVIRRLGQVLPWRW
jgi:hypothetical protein